MLRTLEELVRVRYKNPENSHVRKRNEVAVGHRAKLDDFDDLDHRRLPVLDLDVTVAQLGRLIAVVLCVARDVLVIRLQETATAEPVPVVLVDTVEASLLVDHNPSRLAVSVFQLEPIGN